MNKRQKKKKEKMAIKIAEKAAVAEAKAAKPAKAEKPVKDSKPVKETKTEAKSKPVKEKETAKGSEAQVVIDFAAYDTRAAFHAAFHKEEAFPEYEGNNLDAIFDMLTEIGTPLSITVKNLRSWEAAADSYKGNIEKLLVRADKENPALTISIEG
ncbi:MAG: barstar family protein [Lachnospiraceae bacterium]|nr:barstar family protein [Lachnospiraceae bacterium]